MFRMINLTKYALAFLWISTGIISAFISPDIGFSLLFKANINGLLADVFVYGGSLVELSLGIWILTNKQTKLCCWLQIATITIYTLLLTIIDSSFWLHPFGPLTKNIPILALIFVILNQDTSKPENQQND